VNIFSNIMQVLQLVSAVVMIGLILVQHGKGADAGAAFGSGGAGSASLFGASGSANFLSRSTAVLATLFLVSTLMLASLGGHRPASSGSVLESVAPATATPVVEPVVPATGAAQIPGK
jgi:preprotein translocase subunit SecG